MESIGSPVLWAGFTLFVLAMLALDLGVFHRKAHAVSVREALVWSTVWIGLALAFNAWLWMDHGSEAGLQFLTGYLIEKALAVDNIFVFLVLFASFGVPLAYQHRVLFWGILGALVMRAVFILLGAALIQRFHWVLYVFGLILVVTGIKLLIHRYEQPSPQDNPLFRMFRRVIPSVPDYDGSHFFTVRDGRRYATPLFLVLVAVETTDLVFAVDSIPAIFAVTQDPFIVYTSNIFAILGLRSMYFLLAGVVEKLRYLKLGLSLVLLFVGVKMLLIDVYKIPIGISLGVVFLLLAGAAGASLVYQKRHPEDTTPIEPPPGVEDLKPWNG